MIDTATIRSGISGGHTVVAGPASSLLAPLDEIDRLRELLAAHERNQCHKSWLAEACGDYLRDRTDPDSHRLKIERAAKELAAVRAEVERLRSTNRSHEAQLVEIAGVLGKDARHSAEGTISGVVKEELARLRALNVSLSERCHGQSELLAQRAEG